MVTSSTPIKSGTDIGERFRTAPGPSSSVPRQAPPSSPKRQTTVAAARFPRQLSQIRGDLAGLSGPKFTSSTSALVSLLLLNFAWSIWRTIVNHKSGLRQQLTKNVAGIWVVGFGILILAEFQPQLALLFTILFTIGNILTTVSGQGNAIKTLTSVFTKGG